MGRRWLIILVIGAVGAGVWWLRRGPAQYADAYVADRSAVLWSATAQVRRQVANLGYGERVSVLGHSGELTEVRAADGTHGWMDSRLLMAPALWNRVADVLSEARNSPVQATGHTRTISNVHIDPGRDSARTFQFGRNVPVAVLARQVAAVSSSANDDAASPDDFTPSPADKPDKPDMEDWLLVLYSPVNSGSNSETNRQSAGPSVAIAGWVLSRFIELDPPSPIGDYTSAAGRRVVAWQRLNTVADTSGAKPQYLVAAAKGGEGQPCDFTSIRVYTWGAARMRYETSYVENNLCGRLPMRVTQTPDGPEFRFNDDNNREHAYRLMQTVVRRIPAAGAPPPARARTKPRDESRADLAH
jgi:hypothetical protein